MAINRQNPPRFAMSIRVTVSAIVQPQSKTSVYTEICGFLLRVRRFQTRGIVREPINNIPTRLKYPETRVREGSRKVRSTLVAPSGTAINNAPSSAGRVASRCPLEDAVQWG